MSDTTSKRLFEQLQQVIELPEYCRSLKVEMSVDHASVVTAEFFAKNKLDGVVTRRFKVVEIEGDSE